MHLTTFVLSLLLVCATGIFAAIPYSVLTVKSGEGVFLHTLQNGSIHKKQLIGIEYGTFDESPDAEPPKIWKW
jgi:hypothetical protein